MHCSMSMFRYCLLLLQLVTFFCNITHAAVPASTPERCHPQDKKALLDIKKELNNPTALSSWDPTTECCNGNWQGVNCYNALNHHRVDYLSLSDINISRPLPIPPSIANLPYLNSLYITAISNLTGPIPESITTLTKLCYLQISGVSLSSTIPEFLSSLNNLIILGLVNNHLSGSIPPSLSRLPNLQGLQLNDNSLSGSIPESFGSFSSKFNYLDISSNQISGRIPMTLEKLNLAFVFMNDNKLEGDASMLLQSKKNSTLGKVDLSRNKLAFDLGRLTGFSDKLDSLDLSNNQIYGKVPEEIKSLEYLRNFNVSYNNLCGRIPTGGSMRWFDASSYLHNKCLCGSPLPSCRKLL